MPTYNFIKRDTREVEVHFLKISEYDAFLEANPHLEAGVCGTPSIGDPIKLGITKPSEGFRDVLRNMQTKHRGNTIRVR